MFSMPFLETSLIVSDKKYWTAQHALINSQKSIMAINEMSHKLSELIVWNYVQNQAQKWGYSSQRLY